MYIYIYIYTHLGPLAPQRQRHALRVSRATPRAVLVRAAQKMRPILFLFFIRFFCALAAPRHAPPLFVPRRK